MIQTEHIKKLATDAGFDLCGVTRCQHFAQNEVWFREWLDKGLHSSLGYLEQYLDRRFDTRHLVEGAQTVVVCGVSYKNHASEGYPADFQTKIASYACTRDYHKIIKTMLMQILGTLQAEDPTLHGKAFTDTAPLLEKRLAVEAGLGWIGRQSLLVTPRYGSFILLGELVLTSKADVYDTPFDGSRCGRCHNCINSCPAEAIIAPMTIDTRRCISCRTIERVSPQDTLPLDGWIFGCDRCQSCCPYNQKAPFHTNPLFDPLFDPLAMDAAAWRALTDEEFDKQMNTTPLTRSGLQRIKNNIK